MGFDSLSIDEMKDICDIIRFAEKQIFIKTGREFALELRDWAASKTEARMAIDVILEGMGYKLEALRLKYRGWHLVAARQIVCYLVRRYYPKTSLKELQNILGYADHTTVIHCVSVCRQRMVTGETNFMNLFSKAESTLKTWIENQ